MSIPPIVSFYRRLAGDQWTHTTGRNPARFLAFPVSSQRKRIRSHSAKSSLPVALLIMSLALTSCTEMPFASHEETITVRTITGLDYSGHPRAPFLLITEQRVFDKTDDAQFPATLDQRTRVDLQAHLLEGSSTVVKIGGHKVKIFRDLYEFIPPPSLYVITTTNYAHRSAQDCMGDYVINPDGSGHILIIYPH